MVAVFVIGGVILLILSISIYENETYQIPLKPKKIKVSVSDEDYNVKVSDVLLHPPELVIHKQDLKLWGDPKWKSLSGEKASAKDFIKFHLSEAEVYFKNNQEAIDKLQELKIILGV